MQISFPEADKKSDIVTLRGPKDDVDKCYNFLKKLVVDLIASNYRVEVPIFKRFHGNIIGRNGANIKKIKEETNTTIDIPAENSDSDVIVIVGYKDKAEKARDLIIAIQSELVFIFCLFFMKEGVQGGNIRYCYVELISELHIDRNI